jgi:phosphoglycerol transferase MdoB-like AlkP superfamily enzyme
MKRIKNVSFDKIIRYIKKYASTNKLFLSYVIIAIIISFIMRLVTVTKPIYIKSFIGDLMMVTLIGSFGYFLKPKNQFKYFLSWLIFFTILTIGNTIYYRFYQSFLSINLIATASMVSQVNDSVFEKVNICQFLYIIGDIIFILIHKKLNKTKYYYDVEKTENGRKMFFSLIVVSFAIFVFLAATVTAADTSRLQKQWNREYIVQKYGLYVYHTNDLIQSIQPHINTLFGYDEAAYKFRNYYACRWEKESKTNKYTNYFKGKNVIFIHAESIQNFLIDLKINGEYVIPNINKLAHEGMYFNKFYPQISVGTSSDTEFTLNTGLMPSSSGTVFVNYFNRKYYALPYYFNEMGYYTFSAHANNADYWNRKAMHKTLGYQDFYAKDQYIVPDDTSDMDWVGLGLSDKSFFKQLTEILKDIKKNKSPFYGTVITLSNHSPFNDLEKYGEFDVTMNYTYIDENGKEQTGNAPYLDDTKMGNYLKSAHYADEALGEFIEELRDAGILENTIIILYGDHEARLAKKEFERLYNYDPETQSIKDSDDPTYISMDNYNYDLLKNTPLIMWSDTEKFQKKVSSTMGMYDVLPTIANMFGFEQKYALGNDIFSSNEKIVVFPNGNVLTDKVYYSNLNDEYILLQNSPIDSDYINRIKEYANEILDVSNGIVVHDLILKEEDKIGECELENKK